MLKTKLVRKINKTFYFSVNKSSPSITTETKLNLSKVTKNNNLKLIKTIKKRLKQNYNYNSTFLLKT